LGFRTSYANNGPAAVPSRDATGGDAVTLNGWAPARSAIDDAVGWQPDDTDVSLPRICSKGCQRVL
jgi:hypothetical protein